MTFTFFLTRFHFVLIKPTILLNFGKGSGGDQDSASQEANGRLSIASRFRFLYYYFVARGGWGTNYEILFIRLPTFPSPTLLPVLLLLD